MKWNSHLFVLFAVLLLASTFSSPTTASVTPETVDQLKMSLNQLVRQQNEQLAHYKSQLETSSAAELRESVFALSEVLYQCTLSWAGLQAQFNAADATCASQAPHTPASISSDTAEDLNQCLAEVEASFLAVTSPLDESLSAEITASSKLNFWLQSKLFARSTATSSRSSPLDTFDADAASREIFNEAVLWDNVGSIDLYYGVRGLAAPLKSAGEWGFICGLNAFNKLFQKLKNTEAYLNTNCSGISSRDNTEGGDVQPVLKADRDQYEQRDIINTDTRDDGAAASPEAVVKLESRTRRVSEV